MADGEEIRDYLTTEEAAQRLDYTPRHIRNLLNAKVIKGTRLPSGTWRVPRREVERLLGESDPATPIPEVIPRVGQRPSSL